MESSDTRAVSMITLTIGAENGTADKRAIPFPPWI